MRPSSIGDIARIAKQLIRSFIRRAPTLRRAAVVVTRATRDISLNWNVWINTRSHRHELPFDPFKIVWIDPKDVQNVVGDRGIKLFTWKRIGSVESGEWDREVISFESRRTYRGLYHRWVNGGNWNETDLYRQNLDFISRGAIKWGCTTAAQFEDRLEQLEALYQQIKTKGYKTQRQLMAEGRLHDPMHHLAFFSERQRALDEIVISIGRDGELLFVVQGSQHRLTIAKILGLERIPARVLVRHSAWQNLRDAVGRFVSSECGGLLDHQMPHPDLEEVPSRHDSAALLELMLSSLEGRGEKVKTFLEVGGQISAYFTNALAKRGFNCTVVGEGASSLDLLRRLQRANRAEYVIVSSNDISPGAVFDAVIINEAYFRDCGGRAAVLEALRALTCFAGVDVFLCATRQGSDRLSIQDHTFEHGEIVASLGHGHFGCEPFPLPSSSSADILLRFYRKQPSIHPPAMNDCT